MASAESGPLGFSKACDILLANLVHDYEARPGQYSYNDEDLEGLGIDPDHLTAIATRLQEDRLIDIIGWGPGVIVKPTMRGIRKIVD